MSNLLSIEKAFLNQENVTNEFADLSAIKSLNLKIDNAKKKGFGLSISLCEHAFKSNEWWEFTEEIDGRNVKVNQVAMEEAGISWSKADMSDKLYSCGRSWFGKLVRTGAIVTADDGAIVVNNYMMAVKDGVTMYNNGEIEKAPKLSIEEFLKYVGNGNEIVYPELTEVEEIVDGSSDSSDTDEDGESDEVSFADACKVSITIKVDEHNTISLREQDGQYISEQSVGAIASALQELATKIATNGVVTASEVLVAS